jgi:hypothetical protein
MVAIAGMPHHGATDEFRVAGPSVHTVSDVTDLAIRLRAVVKRYGAITAVDGLDLVFGLAMWRLAIRAMTRKLVD